jgi:hypothetical protein
LDPLLGAALDRPTCSPASPIISRNEHSEAVKISTGMPVPSNNTRALRCPSAAAVQEPSNPLGKVGTPGNTPYKGPRHTLSQLIANVNPYVPQFWTAYNSFLGIDPTIPEVGIEILDLHGQYGSPRASEMAVFLPDTNEDIVTDRYGFVMWMDHFILLMN